MKFTMFVTEDAVQFNLEPESDHEKKFLGILSEYQGKVKTHRGVNVRPDEVELHRGMEIGLCQGGYLRIFGTEKTILAITIKKEKEDEPGHPPGSPNPLLD